MKQSKRKGFTLAEVLITLAVIGVVAALAIPTLLNNIGEGQYKSGVKKASAALNQALQLKRARTGDTVLTAANDAALMAYFESELSVIKKDTTNNILYTADGMSFTFDRTAACEATGTTNLASTTGKCLVIVDVNGDSGPGIVSNATNGFNDQYYFVVTDRSVIPATDSKAVDAILN